MVPLRKSPSDENGCGSVWPGSTGLVGKSPRSHLVESNAVPSLSSAVAKSHVKKLLKQLLQDADIPGTSSWRKALLPVLRQCADSISPNIRGGDRMDIRRYVKIKKIYGGQPGDTSYVSGVMFTQGLASTSMPRRITNPRIMLLSFPIEDRDESDSVALQSTNRKENSSLSSRIDKLIDRKPQVMLVGGNVSESVLKVFSAANIAVIDKVKLSVLEAVARCAGAEIISSLEMITATTRIGFCEMFEAKSYIDTMHQEKKSCIVLSGCDCSKGGTIALRGATPNILTKIKRITEFMIYAVHNVRLEMSLMADEYLDIQIEDNHRLLPYASQKLTENKFWSTIRAGMLSFAEVDASSDISIPENGSQGTFYSDAVARFETTVLSASPSVHFRQPYLLMRLQEQERRLVHLKRLRDQDAMEGQYHAAKPSPQPFQLITTETLTQATGNKLSRQIMEVTHAVHDAEYEEVRQTYQKYARQWENYNQENPGLFDPRSHQNIVVLSAVVCEGNKIPCVAPALVTVSFYDDHPAEPDLTADYTLGQYLEKLWHRRNDICSAHDCEKPMMEHRRTYVHNESIITVALETDTQKSSNAPDDNITMWSYCRICDRSSPVMPMSDGTWNYSFGKYLELIFCSDSLQLNERVACPHNRNWDHARYFAFRGISVRFHYDAINLLEIVVPGPRITWKVEHDLALKNEIFTNIEGRWSQFIASVKLRLGGIRFETVAKEKVEPCKKDVEALIKKADDDHSKFIHELQEIYAKTRCHEILPLSAVIRHMLQNAEEWDLDFFKLESNFLSEKDVPHVSLLQLLGMYSEGDSSEPMTAAESFSSTVSSAERPSQTTTESEGLSSQPTKYTNPSLTDSAASTRFGDSASQTSASERAKPISRVATGVNLQSPATDTSSSYPTNPGEKKETAHIQVQPTASNVANSQLSHSARSPQEATLLSHLQQLQDLQYTERRYSSDGDFSAADNPPGLAIRGEKRASGHIITSLKSRRLVKSVTPRFMHKKGSTSSTLEGPEQFDSEHEGAHDRDHKRRFERLRRRFPRILMPRSSTKATVQVYEYVDQAIQRPEPSDGDQMLNGEIPSSREEQQGAKDKIPLPAISPTAPRVSAQSPLNTEAGVTVDSSVDNNTAVQHAQHSSTETSGVESPLNRPPEVKDMVHSLETNTGDLPKLQNSGLFNILTNFWAERSPSGWQPLEYPINVTDHLFSDSDVIVREDEPSSLIAFALNSEDYNVKLANFRKQWRPIPRNESEEDTSIPNRLSASGLIAHYIDEDVEKGLLKSTEAHLKYEFTEGSAKMVCTIFYAEQFDAIRCKTGVADRIVESLSRCVRWASQGGKSQATFLKTLDNRFVLKSLAAVETVAFLSFAPAYFNIIAKSLFQESPSAIAKVIGFFQVFIKNPATNTDIKLNLLVMENLFYDRLPSHIFDLKGSMRNRKIQSTGQKAEVLLDENMLEFISDSPIFVREHCKKLLQLSLWNDTLFLAAQNVMDYSLIIGIDEVKKELVIGMVDYTRTYTLDKKLETWFKDIRFPGGDQTRPTIIGPKEYKSRFQEAMKKYVV
jgi:1-phosphatidylinositol-3-phosphate 5-kinase